MKDSIGEAPALQAQEAADAVEERLLRLGFHSAGGARGAVALDKRVRIETDGDDTELDRSIIEAIKDPLTHIVRNAVDHGVEGPEARVAAGKPEEGVVLVRAYHEGGQVTIEVADDGAGIDLNAVRAKAVELASVTPEQAPPPTAMHWFFI